jgi:hypothetical protein
MVYLSVPELSSRTLRLSHLQTLSVVNIRNIDNFGGYWLSQIDQATEAALKIASESAMSLRNVAGFDRFIRSLPMSILSRLSTLEITCPRGLELFGDVWSYAQSLEYLAIVDLADHIHILEEILDRFTAWENLHSFKLMSLDPVMSPSTAPFLSTFLSRTTNLRRLDTNLPGMDYEGVMEVMATLNTLPQLRVLGMDIRSLTSPDQLARFAEYIPKALTCLHLENSWENLPIEAEEMSSLVGMAVFNRQRSPC